MKLWLDDIRPMPSGFNHHARSVNQVKSIIVQAEENEEEIELISLGHDLGEYADDGEDGICLMDWLVERETYYPIEFHTANPVGRANMQRMKNRYWE
jgi:hypothetical protein